MPIPEQPPFRPPRGFTMRWRARKGLERGFVLRDSHGQELGFFKMPEERRPLVEVFKAHLKPQIVGQTRATIKAVIIFEDSEGKVIGSWELGQPANSQIEAMIEDLASR